MPAVMEPQPDSPIEAATEILHGVAITDPYRWLENQESPCTREWIAAQTRYARSYLDSIPHRDRIRHRTRELLDVETYDSLQKAGNRYFFRKRPPGQEQPSIYMREGIDGPDQLLVDPSRRSTGQHTAVRPLRISPDGRLLLYEVKEGGERTGIFELLDIENRKTLPDALARGYLRGFAFAPDSKAFYYVHESQGTQTHAQHTVLKHALGTRFDQDEEIFLVGQGDNIRLNIVPGKNRLGFLLSRLGGDTLCDFYLLRLGSTQLPQAVIRNAPYQFAPVLLDDDRILAITDRDAPNLKVVELRRRNDSEAEFIDIVPQRDTRIQDWVPQADRIFVSYIRRLQAVIDIFDLSGRRIGEVPVENGETARLAGGSDDGQELFFERESFTKPTETYICRSPDSAISIWAKRKVPFDSGGLGCTRVSFRAKDGTEIPMSLLARADILAATGALPTIMTSYGGFGVPMTPQFSVFVASLIERGCLFALPNIRGGSEFGTDWHEAAKRRNRQVAFDDFISAAEWLIQTGRTQAGSLAIFGGSNSGLLVGAVMTQRPDLFRAVVCMVPMLDMLRYHLFDNARVWKDELGSVEDPEDFRALFRYSPYHNIRNDSAYPATMMISGDADQNCNPLHARKMVARLQAVNVSGHPIVLDYSRYRGHSPVLPLSERVDALTDRIAFLCDQLRLPV
jgi:prolyl oligopeptidase